MANLIAIKATFVERFVNAGSSWVIDTQESREMCAAEIASDGGYHGPVLTDARTRNGWAVMIPGTITAIEFFRDEKDATAYARSFN